MHAKHSLYDLIREDVPHASDQLCKTILQQTDFPLCNLESFVHQVKRLASHYNQEEAVRGVRNSLDRV